MFQTKVEPRAKFSTFYDVFMINKRIDNKNYVRFVFYNNESIQKLAFFHSQTIFLQLKSF
jgi:hypothetical protein